MRDRPGVFVLALAIALVTAACAPGARREPGLTELRTTVQGKLAADAVWQGTVVVLDDVLVPPGRTLRILGGTRVLVRPADTTKTEPEFVDNATELLVRGRLVVEGRPGRGVRFEASDEGGTEGEGRWAGLIFDGGEGEVRHARISGADTGVTLLRASPALSDLSITGVRTGISAHGGAAPRIARVSVLAEDTAVVCLPGSAPAMEAVEALSSEHEALFVAPGASPRVAASSFRGDYADVLWGAAAEPPADMAGARVRRAAAVAVEPAVLAPPAPPFEPRVPPPGAAPSREYRGEQFIGEDTAWEGEVLVDGTVMVSPAARLRLAPGTVVRFAFRDSDGDGVGESEIFVQGQLLAEGTREAPIVFTALDGAGRGRWGAINLMGTDAEESRLAWCLVEKSFRGLHSHFSRFRIEHAVFRDNHRSVQFQESTAAISDCWIGESGSALRFRDSTAAIDALALAGNTLGVQILRSQFSLTGATIVGSALAGLHVRESEGSVAGSRFAANAPGLRASDCRLAIERSRFAANALAGVQLRRTEGTLEGSLIEASAGNGVSTDSPGAVLRGNAITGSLRFALESNAVADVDAAGNWWGPGGPADEAIWDGADDAHLGRVLTDPALAAPPAVP